MEEILRKFLQNEKYVQLTSGTTSVGAFNMVFANWCRDHSIKPFTINLFEYSDILKEFNISYKFLLRGIHLQNHLDRGYIFKYCKSYGTTTQYISFIPNRRSIQTKIHLKSMPDFLIEEILKYDYIFEGKLDYEIDLPRLFHETKIVLKLPFDRILTYSFYEDKYTYQVWNIKSGKCILTLDKENAFYHIKLLSQSQIVVSTSKGTVDLWDITTNTFENLYFGHDIFYFNVFSDYLIALRVDKQNITILNIKENKEDHIYVEDKFFISDHLISETKIITAHYYEIRIWNLSDKTYEVIPISKCGINVRDVRVTPLPHNRLLYRSNKFSNICNLDTLREEFAIEMPESKILKVLNDHEIVDVCENNKTYILNFLTGEQFCIYNDPCNIKRIEILPNENLICARYDGNIQVWDLRSRECILTYKQYNIDSMILLEDGHLCISTSIELYVYS